jgi:hypothetical protein
MGKRPAAEQAQPPQRHPRDILQISLRLPYEEHAWLVEQARANRTTLNAEILARLATTKEQRALLTVDTLVENASRLLVPYLAAAHERAAYGDLINASARLVDLVMPLLATQIIAGETGKAIRTAVDRIHSTRRVLELEAGAKVVSRGTTGSGS